MHQVICFLLSTEPFFRSTTVEPRIKLDYCLFFGLSISLLPFNLDYLLVSVFNTFSSSADATCLPQISWKTPVNQWVGDLGSGGRGKGEVGKKKSG